MEKSMRVNHQNINQNINQNLIKILNLLHDGIYISDSNGITLLVNEPYERLTGISADKVIGKNVFELKKSGVFSSIVNPEVVRTGKRSPPFRKSTVARWYSMGTPCSTKKAVWRWL